MLSSHCSSWAGTVWDTPSRSSTHDVPAFFTGVVGAGGVSRRLRQAEQPLRIQALGQSLPRAPSVASTESAQAQAESAQNQSDCPGEIREACEALEKKCDLRSLRTQALEETAGAMKDELRTQMEETQTGLFDHACHRCELAPLPHLRYRAHAFPWKHGNAFRRARRQFPDSRTKREEGLGEGMEGVPSRDAAVAGGDAS
ncbi:hypothetical protein NDU88_006075 [Pleurodeles waltl]|uniref:Uncharacterized protein n=1 Tax=Pleurodeles waltl TaxID=8319 RepID=A0AAV7NS76_PLEWA|nr:hypothetical protein NDU88_006075 [Pleurodeles waltl]